MRLVIYVLAVLLVAVVVTMFAIQDPGYVLVVRPPWSVELPLTLFTVFLIAAFVAAYIGGRILSHALRLPRGVSLWREKRLGAKSRTAMVEGLTHLAAGEWRLLAWLEREGYSYDIISGYELHNNPDPTNNYKAIILNTHCEYWSQHMFSKLKDFHEHNRGWILNISGNSIYREVDFFEDGSLRTEIIKEGVVAYAIWKMNFDGRKKDQEKKESERYYFGREFHWTVISFTIRNIKNP